MAEGRADAAVHSAKDMPSVMPAISCWRRCRRGPTPATGSWAARWPACPPGALVATDRRGAGRSWPTLRPDLVFTDLRGNMARRVAVGEDGAVSAVVVAVAALERLGWRKAAATCSTRSTCCPRPARAPSPCSAGPTTRTRARCSRAIDHGPSHRALRAERAVLAALGGSCTCRSGPSPRRPRPRPARTLLRVSGLLASGDGHTVIRLTRAGDDPEAVGAAVARALLDGGGAAIEGFDDLRTVAARVTVYLVGAGPGDPGLLTRRGAALLARADVVLHDRLVSPARPRPGAAVGRRSSTWARTPTRRRGARRVRRRSPACSSSTGGASAVVVRLKGGDPFLFGRGGEEVEALAQAGLAWEVVPGGHLGLRRPRRRGHPGHPARPGVVGHRGDGPRAASRDGRRARTGRRWPGRAGRW